MRKITQLFLLTLLVALPVQAEFTPQEKLEIEKLVVSGTYWSKATQELMKIAGDVDPAIGDRGPIADLVKELTSRIHVHRVLITTIFNTKTPGIPPELGFEYDEVPYDRADYLKLFYAKLDEFTGRLSKLDSLLSAFEVAVDHKRESKVRLNTYAAMDIALGFDRSLTYDKPLPADWFRPEPPAGMREGYPYIADPHGDYDNTQHDLAFCLHYLSIGVRRLGADFPDVVYVANYPGPRDTKGLEFVISETTRLIDDIKLVMALHARVNTIDETRELTPERALLWETDFLFARNGTTNKFKNLTLAMHRLITDEVISGNTDPELLLSLWKAQRDYLDAWWGFDRWVRDAFNFIHHDFLEPQP